MTRPTPPSAVPAWPYCQPSDPFAYCDFADPGVPASDAPCAKRGHGKCQPAVAPVAP